MHLLLLTSSLLTLSTVALKKPLSLCEPARGHLFPETATRRRVQVDVDTGKETFYNATDKDAPPNLLLEPPITLTNTTFEEFSWYVRRGYPVIVSDMARDWPMQGWECEDFAREFPDGEMKGEYGGGRVILGERHWMDKVRDAGQHIDGCDTPQCNDRGTKPHAAPHVWHVKDEEPYQTRKRIQNMFRVPYFMEESEVGRALNKPDVNESLEFWLSPPGAGAFAHADAYCTMTASVQLSSHKRWRMMNPGPQVDTMLDRFDTQDSGIYRVSKWTPEYEFMVPKGAGVVFPPYNMHETIADPKQCTTATTFNFFSPQPTRYIRSFLPRLLHTHLGYNERCHYKWDRYATFINSDGYRHHSSSDTPKPRPPFQPSLSVDIIHEHLAWILRAIDTNGNDMLTLDEITNYFQTHPNGAWGKDIRYHTGWAFGRVHKYFQMDSGHQISKALIISIANDTMVYHDLDDDEIITKKELMSSLVQWHTVKSRLNIVQSTLDDALTSEEITVDELEEKMKNIEKNIHAHASALGGEAEDNTSTCIGLLNHGIQGESSIEGLPFWVTSLSEDREMELFHGGGEREEYRDFGSEEPDEREEGEGEEEEGEEGERREREREL